MCFFNCKHETHLVTSKHLAGQYAHTSIYSANLISDQRPPPSLLHVTLDSAAPSPWSVTDIMTPEPNKLCRSNFHVETKSVVVQGTWLKSLL